MAADGPVNMPLALPRNAQIWLPGYLASVARRRRPPAHRETTHVLLCIADHFEPGQGNPGLRVEHERVRRWSEGLPRAVAPYRDSDGRPPQHTFFFPVEQYRADLIGELAGLCEAGLGEIEIHLHHDRDTSAHLRETLLTFKQTLARQHGLLATDRRGDRVYGFIHGNWALDNARPDGRWCGVNDEITILRETGCYADFTMPAAPDPSQTTAVNRIYYAIDDPCRPRSADRGISARVGAAPPPDGLLMVQGPLTLNWSKRYRGICPGLEVGVLDSSPGHQPSIDRFERWVRAGVSVEGRPDWIFVKLHAHGAVEANAACLLGRPMRAFHEALATWVGPNRRLHYVTAREMANIVKAAEAGRTGNPGEFRDYELKRPALMQRTA